MTHYREELAGLLEQRAERLVIRPGELATYCPLDADLDRKAAAALRQSPTVEEVASKWSAARNLFVRHAEAFNKATRYEEASAIADEAARDLDALYGRGG